MLLQMLCHIETGATLEVSTALLISAYTFKTLIEISDEQVIKDLDYQACLRVAGKNHKLLQEA